MPALLLDQPEMINRLPFTNAVIKEALRLFPPANALREGSPEVELVGSDGNG
jgi:cytochrome P450